MPRFERSPLSHRPQIDSLRWFAALSVITLHFLYTTEATALGLAARAGVWLFFVISGFLITRILLQCRDGGGGLGVNLRRFYARRFLRIFPLYYGVLAVIVVFGLPGIRDHVAGFLTYTSNFQFIAQGHWPETAGHFWTLAVEEQFYLVWPLVILTVPRRALLGLVVALAVTAPLWRAWAATQDWSYFATYLPPVAALDTLGLGAILALGVAWYPDRVSSWAKACGVAGFGALALALLAAVVGFDEDGIALDLSITLLAGWLVYLAYVGVPGTAGRVLAWRPFVYLGTISYGIYVFHGFAAYFFSHLGLHAANTNRFVFFLVMASSTIAVAGLSWHFFERPINDLKRHFPYDRPRSAPGSPEDKSTRVGEPA
jgi:peptidoglycan/LPS O-acetylase OafA/YrhL